ncbi:MAG TPA: hypothetical protein VII99_11640 [Bacteroidia bacterium]
MNKVNRFPVLLLICFLLSGCFIFHPKHKCADCPSWNKSGHSQLKISGSKYRA